jgi:hypothetical protein
LFLFEYIKIYSSVVICMRTRKSDRENKNLRNICILKRSKPSWNKFCLYTHFSGENMMLDLQKNFQNCIKDKRLTLFLKCCNYTRMVYNLWIYGVKEGNVSNLSYITYVNMQNILKSWHLPCRIVICSKTFSIIKHFNFKVDDDTINLHVSLYILQPVAAGCRMHKISLPFRMHLPFILHKLQADSKDIVLFVKRVMPRGKSFCSFVKVPQVFWPILRIKTTSIYSFVHLMVVKLALKL